MRRIPTTALAFAAVVAAATSASAQPPRKPENPRQRLQREFTKGPAVGSKLPDVAAFDAAGKPFRLGSLKGHHTVLVFGCLT